MSEIIINATTRADVGKGASRRLRHAENLPAVIYGGSSDPVSLTLKHSEIIRSAEEETFYSGVVTVNIDGKPENAIVRDMQRHPFKPKIAHIDFQRVNMAQTIHKAISIHFLNEEGCPGVKAGGVIQHSMTELEVSCQVKDLPEYLELDLGELDMDGVLHISDVKLPAGVTSVALSHGEDHDLPVASIHKPRAAAEVEEAPAADADADAGEAPAAEGDAE